MITTTKEFISISEDEIKKILSKEFPKIKKIEINLISMAKSMQNFYGVFSSNIKDDNRIYEARYSGNTYGFYLDTYKHESSTQFNSNTIYE